MSGNDSKGGMKASSLFRGALWTVMTLVLVLAYPKAGSAQVLYGTLVGHVTDPSGAAVPGAKVRITNQGTNISTETTTNASGDYTFTNIVAGTYTLQITQQGFRTYQRRDIPVTINAVARVDVALTLGAV